MNKKSNEDMVILNGYWFYRDGLITLETFLEVIKNLVENHKKRMEEFEKEEQSSLKQSQSEEGKE